MIYIAYGDVDYLLETRLSTSTADRGAVSALYRMGLGDIVELSGNIIDVYGEVGAAVVELRPAEAELLRRRGVRLEESEVVQLALKESVPLVGAPRAWELGFSGKGVKIAVIDSGISETCGLEGKVIYAKSFINEPAEDLNGHGTHVAAIAVSDDREYRGVAPGAHIVNLKAFNRTGRSMTHIVARAMYEAIKADVDVVNMSFGGRGRLDDLLSRLANLMAARGIVPVAAAGNEGPGRGTVSSPGTAAHAITVGAVDKEKKVAPYSSRGPVGNLIKPDLVAPGGIKGQEIVASRPRAIDPPCKKIGTCYMGCIGTSMAAPHVSGAAALLIEAMGGRREDTAFIIKRVLTETAEDLGQEREAQGAGLLRIDKAIEYLKKPSHPAPTPTAPLGGLTMALGAAALAIIGAALINLTRESKQDLVYTLRQLYKNNQITMAQLVELYKQGKISFDEFKKIIE